MHDALLFEYTRTDTPGRVVDAFQGIMTEVLRGQVAGKASIGDFAEREQMSSAPRDNEI